MVQLHLALGFADLFLDLFDERALLFDLFMPEQDGADHIFVGNFLRARFDHHDGVFRSGKAQSDRALFALGIVGVDDVFTVYHPYLHRTRRSRPRDIGNAQSDRAAEHRERFGGNVRIDGKRGRDDHDVVVQPLREKGANGAVDEAGGEYPLIACPALALFKAARDLADRIHLLFEVDLQREKVHPLSGRFRHGYIDHYDCIAAANDARTVCLFRVLARFDDHLAAADLRFKLSEILCHCLLLALFLREPLFPYN